MKHIIAFAGTNSKQSINKQLVTYTANLVEKVNLNILDLNEFKLPLYSIDVEKAQGIPENAYTFINLLKSADGIIISLAEHNGAYTTVFKNLFDWLSRIESKLFFGKPMLLMATSPGGRGGASVLAMAKDRFPRHEAKIISEFSLPSFGVNFSNNKIVNEELDITLKQAVLEFQKHL